MNVGVQFNFYDLQQTVKIEGMESGTMKKNCNIRHGDQRVMLTHAIQLSFVFVIDWYCTTGLKLCMHVVECYMVAIAQAAVSIGCLCETTIINASTVHIRNSFGIMLYFAGVFD